MQFKLDYEKYTEDTFKTHLTRIWHWSEDCRTKLAGNMHKRQKWKKRLRPITSRNKNKAAIAVAVVKHEQDRTEDRAGKDWENEGVLRITKSFIK